MNEEVRNLINRSNKNKILVVTHSCVMKALTASEVQYKPLSPGEMFSTFDLVGGKDFQHCSIYPFLADLNQQDEGE